MNLEGLVCPNCGERMRHEAELCEYCGWGIDDENTGEA